MNKEKIINFTAIAGVLLLITGGLLAVLKGSFDRISVLGMSAGGALTLFYIFVNRETFIAVATGKKARYGINAFIYTLVFVGIIVVIQAIFTFKSAQFDLTKNKKYTLSGQTKSVLDSLEKKVDAYYFYSVRARNFFIEDTLKKYDKMTGKFTFRSIDADKNPSFAQQFGVDRYGIVVLHREDNDSSEKIDVLSEEGITNGLVRITRDTKKKIYFSAGHNERSLDAPRNEKTGYSIFKQELESYNYGVEQIEIFKQAGGIPKDCELLVIAGPGIDLFKPEVKIIGEYIRRGGRLLVFYGPFKELSNLNSLIAGYGIKPEKAVVVTADNLNKLFGADALTPIISDYEPHEITKKIIRSATFFPVTRPLEINSETEGVEVQALVKTNERSWGETDMSALSKGIKFDKGTDLEPPLIVAAASKIDNSVFAGSAGQTVNTKAEIVVYGSAEIASNTYIGAAANKDLILNTVSYLAADENLISIRPKDRSFEPLFMTETQKKMVRIIPMIFLPLIVAAVGVMIYIRRRRS